MDSVCLMKTRMNSKDRDRLGITEMIAEEVQPHRLMGLSGKDSCARQFLNRFDTGCPGGKLDPVVRP